MKWLFSLFFVFIIQFRTMAATPDDSEQSWKRIEEESDGLRVKWTRKTLFLKLQQGDTLELSCISSGPMHMELRFPGTQDLRRPDKNEFLLRDTHEAVFADNETKVGTLFCNQRTFGDMCTEDVLDENQLMGTANNGIVRNTTFLTIPCENNFSSSRSWFLIRSSRVQKEEATNRSDTTQALHFPSDPNTFPSEVTFPKNYHSQPVNIPEFCPYYSQAQTSYQSIFKCLECDGEFYPDEYSEVHSQHENYVSLDEQKKDFDGAIVAITQEHEFPFIGAQNYVLNCSVRNSKHLTKLFNSHLWFDCPRCGNEWTSRSGLMTQLTIAQLNKDDEGLYTCNWYIDENGVYVRIKSSVIELTVSSTEAQVKYKNPKPNYPALIHRGKNITLSVLVVVYPDSASYHSYWELNRSDETSRNLTENKQCPIVSRRREVDNRGVLESITLSQAPPYLSGRYILSTEVMGVIYTTEWSVEVKDGSYALNMNVIGEHSIPFFEQTLYKVGTPVRVQCWVSMYFYYYNLTMYASDRNGEWVQISPDELEKVSGVHRSGIEWKTTVGEDQKVRCIRNKPGGVLEPIAPFLDNNETEMIEAIYENTTNLYCPIEGFPEPYISWFRDDSDLPLNHSKVYQIPVVVAGDAGGYKCTGTNRAGENEKHFVVKVTGIPQNLSWTTVGGASLVISVLLISTCALMFMWFKQRRRGDEHVAALQALYDQLMSAEVIHVPQPSGSLSLEQRIRQTPYDQCYEIERSNLEIGPLLGQGQFGKVAMGFLRKPKRAGRAQEERLRVAVKMPLDGQNVEQQTMLAHELKIMIVLEPHPNVLSLIGAVTKNMRNGELFVVIELCSNGSMKDFLVNFEKVHGCFIDDLPSGVKETCLSSASVLATSDLFSFAMQVAHGMEYLSSVQCIHRDLAARNIMVTENKLCRIADFGLAKQERNNYYRSEKNKDTPKPVRWMSPESIQHNLYTQSSDVWSFGILLYEIFSLGGTPYPRFGNDVVSKKILAGERNEKPKYATDNIYLLMQRCWEGNASERPVFQECYVYLRDHFKLTFPAILQQVELLLTHERDTLGSYSEWRRADVILAEGEVEKEESGTRDVVVSVPRSYAENTAYIQQHTVQFLRKLEKAIVLQENQAEFRAN